MSKEADAQREYLQNPNSSKDLQAQVERSDSKLLRLNKT